VKHLPKITQQQTLKQLQTLNTIEAPATETEEIPIALFSNSSSVKSKIPPMVNIRGDMIVKIPKNEEHKLEKLSQNKPIIFGVEVSFSNWMQNNSQH
jgi:hypothetical protein